MGASQAIMLGVFKAAASGTTHAYWRLYVTETQDTSLTRCDLRNFQFREVAGVDQYTAGGDTVTANDAAANAALICGSSSTAATWSSLATSAGPWWIAIQYATPRNVVQARIVCSNSLNRAPRDFLLQYSDDGSAWTTAKTVSSEPAWTTLEARVYSIP